MPFILSPTQTQFKAGKDGLFNTAFQPQVDFFQSKLNLPSQHFDDVIRDGHNKAFIVAGATKAELLDDLRTAVDKAISEGQGIDVFRECFNDIVAKHGWTGWKGEDTEAGVKWRTQIIYDTNISTSYAAGRWKQLNDPDLLSIRPYWKYIHSEGVQNPRPLHVSWSGLVLRHDDPWWQSHFPPNGWRCHCRITAVAADDFKGQSAPDDGTYTKIDRYGNTHIIPKGIDYTFDYAPGAKSAASLESMVTDKLIRIPARLGADMMKALQPVMQKNMSAAYRQWLNKVSADSLAQKQSVVVGAIDPALLSWLAQSRSPIPLTAEISVPGTTIIGSLAAGVPMAAWEALPLSLQSPIAVLYDNASGDFLYVVATNPQLAIQVNFQTKNPKTAANGIVAAYLPDQLDEKLKNGALTLISGSLGGG